MQLRTSAQSSTILASTPKWLMEPGPVPGTPPDRLTRPWVALRPGMPQSAAGFLTDPALSVPMEARPSPAATAAAEPPLEPPVARAVSHGFRLGP